MSPSQRSFLAWELRTSIENWLSLELRSVSVPRSAILVVFSFWYCFVSLVPRISWSTRADTEVRAHECIDSRGVGIINCNKRLEHFFLLTHFRVISSLSCCTIIVNPFYSSVFWNQQSTTDNEPESCNYDPKNSRETDSKFGAACISALAFSGTANGAASADSSKESDGHKY